MQHGIREESQSFQIFLLIPFVASSGEVAHNFKSTLDHFSHPFVDFLHLVASRKVQDEDITLLVPHLQCANLVLLHLFSLQFAVLLSLEDCHSVIFLIIFILLVLLYLSDVVANFSVEPFFDFITNLDDFAIFHDTFW